MFRNVKKKISLFMSLSMCAALCATGSNSYVSAAKSSSQGGHSGSSQTTVTSTQTSTLLSASQTANATELFTLTTSSSTWQGGFNASMQLNSNVGSKISDWTLTLYNVDFDITNIWCAEALKSGTSYIITPMNWNQTINAAQYVNWGFGGTGTFPSTFDFSVTYTVNGTEYTYNSNETSEEPSESVTPSETVSEEPIESVTPSETVSEEPIESVTPSETVSEEPIESVTPSETVSEEPVQTTETVASVVPSEEASPSPSASTSDLISSPLNSFNRTMPSTGNVRALIIMVDFADVTYSNGLSADALESSVFGDENTKSSNYPFESSKAYYSRASYGNLNLTGDVYTYTASNSRSYYYNKNEYETLAMEAMKALDSQIDYSDYDGNNDGYIDCLTFSVPTNGSSDDDFWYGCQATWYLNNNFKLDNEKVKGYVINDAQPTTNEISYYNSTLCHEFGHLMGLPDYYKYYSSSDWEGLNGDAGYELMDDAISDYSSFSKLMLGWLKTDEVQVYDTSSSLETFEISSISDTGSCVILPIGDLDDNYFSEYFIIEYVTTTNNNKTGYFNKSGIRIMHVNAETTTDPYSGSGYKTFKYENYGSAYDTSDSKQRVLRLVNDGNGFYTSGSTITYGTSNFAGYDTSGSQTINTGYSISVGSLSGGKYTVTVTK